MKWFQLLTWSLFGLAGVAATAQASGPRVAVGLSFGVPCYRPWYGPYPYYYAPVYYVPPPRAIYEPAPVVVQPAPVVVTSPPATVSSAPVPVAPVPVAPVPVVPAPSVVRATSNSPADVAAYTQQLTNPDEAVRRDAIMELGRLKAEQSLDALHAALAGDRSPTVRDAAARALGLIGSQRSLTALLHAAQADSDRDVRRSAQFAVEVIQIHNRSN